MVKVKISGLTNFNDARDAANLGADFLGFSFIKDSPQKISKNLSADIVSKIPPFVKCVGSFENESAAIVLKILKKNALSAVQFNGAEMHDYCLKFKQEGFTVFKFFQETDISLDGSLPTYNNLNISDFVECIDYIVMGIASSDENMDDVYKRVAQKSAGLPVFLTGANLLQSLKKTPKDSDIFGLDFDRDIERLPKRKDYEKMNKAIKIVHGLK
jgi:phosphoribosylanthranilate isomerase